MSDALGSKILGALLTGVNRAYPYAQLESTVSSPSFFHSVSHQSSSSSSRYSATKMTANKIVVRRATGFTVFGGAPRQLQHGGASALIASSSLCAALPVHAFVWLALSVGCRLIITVWASPLDAPR